MQGIVRANVQYQGIIMKCNMIEILHKMHIVCQLLLKSRSSTIYDRITTYKIHYKICNILPKSQGGRVTVYQGNIVINFMAGILYSM